MKKLYLGQKVYYVRYDCEPPATFGVDIKVITALYLHNDIQWVTIKDVQTATLDNTDCNFQVEDKFIFASLGEIQDVYTAKALDIIKALVKLVHLPKLNIKKEPNQNDTQEPVCRG